MGIFNWFNKELLGYLIRLRINNINILYLDLAYRKKNESLNIALSVSVSKILYYSTSKYLVHTQYFSFN